MKREVIDCDSCNKRGIPIRDAVSIMYEVDTQIDSPSGRTEYVPAILDFCVDCTRRLLQKEISSKKWEKQRDLYQKIKG